jgi:two-component system sensor histidine kinase/response regulator
MSLPVRSVLVVEDDPLSSELISDVLMAAHWRVICVTTGEQAVVAVSSNPPDLVLLDIGLPGMDGHTTLRALRRLPGRESLPVIGVSAHSMRGDAERAVEEGFDAYITKPIDTRGLVRTIEEILGRRH